MKILEIQSVVANPIQSCGSELLFADLEFQNKDYRTNDQDDIDALSHSGDCILEVNETFSIRKYVLEDLDLLQPCIPLSLFQREGVVRCELAENLLRSSISKFGN